jgi:hypothetical protein
VRDPRVRLILDTSAVIAYVGESIDVGEPITEIVDEDGLIGVPVVCLVEAAARIPEGKAAGLAVLARHHAVVVLDGRAEDWEALTGWAQVLGRADSAAALLEALDRPATYVLTGEPQLYGDGVESLIIGF